MSGGNNHMQENALLRLCARPFVTAEVIDTAGQLLSAEIDWTYLIRAGFQQQLIPLLDRILQQVREPRVPGDILHALRYRIEKNQERNEYLAQEWFAVSGSLASALAGTPLPIQGPPVTARAYGDLSLRQAGMLAFLVDDGDFALAHESLVSQGFRKQEQSEGIEHSAANLWSISAFYERIRDGMTLDMHSVRCRDVCPSEVSSGTLWGRAKRWHYGAEEVLVLAPDDHLIALCLQGEREQWRILGTLADVAHFLHRHRELDIGALLIRSRSLGCEMVTKLGLMLTARLAEMKQLAMLVGGQGAKGIERDAAKIWAQLFEGDLANGRTEESSAAESDQSVSDGSAASQATLSKAKMDEQQHWASRSEAWQRWSDLTLPAMADLTENLFDAARITEDDWVLDLACGPGDTSLLLSPRVGPTGIVVSTDLIPNMVDTAVQRAGAAKLGNVKWAVADMENLPFADQVFDAVVCRLGIMYCPRAERALSEALRVLKPGGRAAFLVCGPRENNHVLTVLHEVFWDLFDIRPATEPAPFRFAAKNSLAPLLRTAGFTNVEERELRSERTLPRTRRFWQPGAERAIGWKLDSLPPVTRSELERRMNAALQDYVIGDNYQLSSHYRVGVGTKSV